MSVFKTLEFDDINTLEDFDVYISGEGAYNSPERSAEFVTISGRNGDFILDNGHFENIEVKYQAGIKAKDHAEFMRKFRRFRSYMAAKRGYQRLTDEYNPDEFRLATFVNAIEAEAVDRAAQFELVFNCKPQRFLKDGEDVVDVVSGGTINNPTPFDASPMIMTYGYGNLTVNGYEIKIINETLGLVTVAKDGWLPLTIDQSLVNNDDPITVGNIGLLFELDSHSSLYRSNDIEVRNVTAPSDAAYSIDGSSWRTTMGLFFSNLSFDYGTAATETDTWNIQINLIPRDGSATVSASIIITANVEYDGANKIDALVNFSGSERFTDLIIPTDYSASGITAISSVSTLGEPTYIDCDLGEVYKIVDGSFVSLNRLTDLGSNLPVLSTRDNDVTFDSTFTRVQIMPRWWFL